MGPPIAISKLMKVNRSGNFDKRLPRQSLPRSLSSALYELVGGQKFETFLRWRRTDERRENLAVAGSARKKARDSLASIRLRFRLRLVPESN